MRVLELLLPPGCAGCGGVGSLLCGGCIASLRPPAADDDRFVAADGGVVVGDALLLALAAFAYGGPLRHSLAALKYTGTSRVAEPIARASLPALDRLLAITGPAALVPVPVHVQRRRERGYNQAELLARELGSTRHLPIADVLDRIRPTTKQHRLDRAARLANLRDAFALRADARAVPLKAVLVDDIITTTATLETCASILRAAGVQGVYGFAIAREL